MEAFIYVKAHPGRTREVISRLAEGKGRTFNITGIKKVYRTTGEWDAVAIVEARDLQGVFDISDLISNLKSPGPIVTKTIVVPMHPKQVGDP